MLNNTYTISKNRYIDTNNFLYIKNQCVMRSGVFEYRASEIMELLQDSNINPNDIIKVYRPASELKKIKDLFANKPITREHDWVYTQKDNKNIVGNVGSDITFNSEKGEIIADLITIYDAVAINDIANGIRDKLSAGFKHDLTKQEGEYEGIKYDYIQTINEINHLAICESPRDSNLIIHDSKNSNFNLLERINMGYRNLVKLVDTFRNKKSIKGQDSVSDETLEKVKGLLENLEGEELENALKLLESSIKKQQDSDSDADNKTTDSDDDNIAKTTDSDDNSNNADKAQDSDDTELAKTLLAFKDEILACVKAEIEALKNPQVTQDSDNPDAKTQDDDVNAGATDNLEKIKEELREEVTQQVQNDLAKAEQEFTEAYDSVSNVIGAFNAFNKDSKRKNANEIYAYGVKVLSEKQGLNLGKVQDSKTAFLVASKMLDNTKNAQDSKVTFTSDIKSKYELPNRFVR